VTLSGAHSLQLGAMIRRVSADRRARARPRTGTKRVPRAERSQQMVSVASGVFAERGFTDVSMDEIAARVGVTKPMLYSYFGSKEGLFAACAEEAGAQLRTHLADIALAGDDGPDERLWRGILAVFTFVEDNREGWMLLYPPGADRRGPLGEGADHAREAMAGLITGLFEQVASRQGVPAEMHSHLEPIAHAFTAATIAAASRWVSGTGEPKEAAALRLMNFAWRGLGGLLDGRIWLPGQNAGE
jgi:AcrR family transcriptional regulator